MFDHSKKVSSASGTAEATSILSSGGKVQIGVRRIAVGTGTLTVTVKAGTDTEYGTLVSGTIDLTAPIDLVFEGSVNAVKAVSSSGSDDYVLEVIS